MISCGASHVVTVGSMENLLLWGKNDSQQLGFVPDISMLTEPTFFQIKHDFYKICPVQVSCGPNFTSILALARMYLRKKLDATEETKANLAYSNSEDARTLIEELKKRGLGVLKVFKKKEVKFKSFCFVVTDLLGLDWDEQRIKDVIRAIGIPQNATDLELTPLYERVFGRHEGCGIIYLFSRFPAETTLPPFLVPIHDEQRQYYKIETSTTPLKVLAGAHFITYLDSDGFISELDLNALDRGPVQVPLPREYQVLDFAVCKEQRFVLTSANRICAWGWGYIEGGRSVTEVKTHIFLSIPNVINVFSGENFNLATNTTSEGKRVHIWGNFSNKNMFQEDLTMVREQEIPIKESIVDACVQERSVLLLSDKGSVYLFGRYGDIPHHKAMLPIAVPGKFHYVDDMKVTQIASNTDGLYLALTQHGSLYTWTFDKRLSPFLGRKPSKMQPWNEPCELQKYEFQFFHKKDVLMPGSEGEVPYKILKVRCAYSNTVVLTHTNEVFITGSDYHGQLGQIQVDANDTEEAEEDDVQEEAEGGVEDPKEFDDLDEAYSSQDATAFQPIPKFSGKSKIRINKLACGAFHFLALDETYNALFAWGLNVHGQLGLKHVIPKVRVPQLITFEEIAGNKVLDLACGDSHSLVLTDVGVFAFGNAERGRLGIGRTNSIDLMHTPMRIFFTSDDPEDQGQEVRITDVTAGQSHSLALSEKGKVYSWVLST